MGDDPKSLKVIGLISGGKDSFFSLLHCLANNHRVVALANLYPPPTLSIGEPLKDLNSYMYQTAGHGLIPLYSDALGLPVFRQEISGSALNSSKVYKYAVDNQNDPHRVDETEDMMPLLRRILQQYPHANALCSGAILSTYQRTRIESVARRLNLVPLSYLWQYPSLPPPSAGGLLDDMAAVGFDVRIVKVASGGLEEEMLWQNLMDCKVRAMVERGMRRFGGSVLGEGGEYETLVVNGPMGLFKKNIVVDDQEMWMEHGGGGEARLTFREHAGTTVTNDGSEPADGQKWKALLRTIGIWDGEFEELYHQMRGKIPFITGQPKSQSHVTGQMKAESPSKSPDRWEVHPVIFRTQAMLTISNLTPRQPETIATDQMSDINSRLIAILTENDCSTDDIIFTTLLLRSMTDFTAVNGIYGQLFTKPNPPARVTVACGESLPKGVSVMVSFVVNLSALTTRDVLHVQSRSYWAPANIGPYSQAISVPTKNENGSAIVYVAGQIPLVPASMEEVQVEDDNSQTDSENKNEMALFQMRACLALQHLWRIGKAMCVSWWIGGIAFITGKRDVRMKAITAWEIWKGVHQKELWENDGMEEDGLDAWDKKYGGFGSFVVEAEVRSLPDIARLSDSPFVRPPGFFAVQVDELPRGCNIEWQGLGVTNPYADVVSYMTINSASSDEEFCMILLATLDGFGPFQLQQATVYTQRAVLLSGLSIQIVPCSAVYGPEGNELAAGIVLQKA
ncbi:MAG: hypothetical protein Q9175_001067 [Cornicularia normoerica]